MGSNLIELGKKYGPWLLAVVGWALLAILATKTGNPVPPLPPIPMQQQVDGVSPVT